MVDDAEQRQQGWHTVAVTCSVAAVEILADVLWQSGPPAVEERATVGAETVVLLAGYPDEATAEDTAAAITASGGTGVVSVTVSPVVDDGLDAWRDHAQIVHAGPFTVVPAWLEGDPVSDVAMTTGPVSTEPVTTEPVSTEPVSTESAVTETASGELAGQGPGSTRPANSEWASTEPASTGPAGSELTTQPAGSGDPVRTELPAGGARVMRIDPGSAFGSGSHPTTRLVLAAVAERVEPGHRVLDVGCGSGILAIAGAMCGASVVGVDVDPAAAGVTVSNAVVNGVEHRVQFVDRSLADLSVEARERDARFDVVLANLLSPIIVELAPDLTAVVEGGGHLVVSGLLADRQGPAREALARTDQLDLVGETLSEGWAALTFRRRHL